MRPNRFSVIDNKTDFLFRLNMQMVHSYLEVELPESKEADFTRVATRV